MPDSNLNPVVVAIVVVSASVVVFSALKVTDAVPALRYILTAVAAGLSLALIAFGALRADRASKGFIVAAVDVFTWILTKISKSTNATVLACIVIPAVAAASYLFGPASTDRIDIICDEAGYIRSGEVPRTCDGVLEYSYWSFVFNENDRGSSFECLDTGERTSWKPEKIKEEVFRCGSVQWKAKDIASGIKSDGLDGDTVSGRRTLDGLEVLRSSISGSIAPRNVTDNLLIATWNFRSFGKIGRRPEEAFYYIAQMISYFDVVAVQEVGGDISSLDKLMSILGENWAVSYSGISPQLLPRQRFAFIYDSRKVEKGQFSSTAVMIGESQLLRPPYLAEFKIGERSVILCNIHIVWGKKPAERREEVERLSEHLVQQIKVGGIDSNNLILLGDFQSESSNSEQIQVIREAGFLVDEHLSALNTNYRQTHPYDQIALYSDTGEMRVGRYGVIDFFKSVFRSDQQDEYYADMGSRGKYDATYDTWRTFQMSDHLPKWVEVRFSE